MGRDDRPGRPTLLEPARATGSKGMPMRVIQNPPSRLLLLSALALATVAASVSGIDAPAAAAPVMRAAASHRPATAFAGQARLTADSCRTASWCMAVGSYTTTDHVAHSLAMIFNGASWRSLKNPPGKQLDEVACSSTTFCMAEGGPTGAVRWNGTTWRSMPSPEGGLPSLTCASRTFCVRLHGNVPSVWNGTSWRDANVTDFCKGSAPGPCGLSGVSCGSISNCIAVGTWTVSQEPVQNAVADIWNGKKWIWDTEVPAKGNPAQLNTVGCAGTFCLTAGVASNDQAGASIATADTWVATSSAWTDVSPTNLGGICGEFGSCAWAGVVACGNASSCMTLAGLRPSQFWNGTSWQAAKPISAGQGSGLQDISCGGSDCLAVGFQTAHGLKRTLAELWNGSAWSIVKTPKGP
jgi:hypothetical protein